MVQAMDSLCPVAVAYAETDNVTVPTTSCPLHFVKIGTTHLTRIAQNEKICKD